MSISSVPNDNNSRINRVLKPTHLNNKIGADSKRVEIAPEDLIERFKTTIIPSWQEEYGLSDRITKGLEFTAKRFLNDNDPLRVICALGNEVAVALIESMKQWKLPKTLANTLFYGLWGVSVGSCGARAVLRGLGTENLKPFVESSIQDGIAAIFGPTGVVMIANKAQDMLYKTVQVIPQSAINFVRPIISVTLAEKAIPKILDPVGKKVGKLASRIIPDETYKRYSESISRKLQKKLSSSATTAA